MCQKYEGGVLRRGCIFGIGTNHFQPYADPRDKQSFNVTRLTPFCAHFAVNRLEYLACIHGSLHHSNLGGWALVFKELDIVRRGCAGATWFEAHAEDAKRACTETALYEATAMTSWWNYSIFNLEYLA